MPVDVVVDSSIAHAAGSEAATSPDSRACRDCLNSIRQHGHSIVLSPELLEEWKGHQSRFASAWRTSMYARRLVRHIESPLNIQLRGRIQASADRLEDWTELEKDCPLVEAALVTDRTVISLDETARNLFRKCSARVGELRNILWANPCRPAEEVQTWIGAGCTPPQGRGLGVAQPAV